FDAGFASPQAMRFRAGPPDSPLDALLGQRRGLLAQLDRVRRELMGRDRTAADLEALADRLHTEVAALRRQGDEKDKLIAGLNYHLVALQWTIGWRFLERARRIRDRLVPPDTRRRDLYWLVRRSLDVLLDEGLSGFVQKSQYKLRLLRQGQWAMIK